MQRTTTPATLLVTVALTALTGCVTVQRPAPPAAPPRAAPVQPTAPRPDGSTAPRVVQAPAEQALEMVGSARRPRHERPPAPRHTPEAPPPAPGTRAHEPARPRAHPRPEHRHRHADADVPNLPDPAPRAPDVCNLGRTYGGWKPDSPEAEICERTYGR